MLRVIVCTLVFSAVSLASSLVQAAERIYQLPAQKSFSVSMSAVRAMDVVDSIPQLNVVILREGARVPAGAVDLGENRMITLDLPKSKSLTLPRGYWGLQTIEAAAAWEKSTGEGVLVAVSDTGVEYDNPDLAPNLWANPGESGNGRENNGIDDDRNGYVDDVNGWDFVDNRPSRKDHHYHGTHVAGTIAAKWSSRISGVAPNAKIMSVPFIGGSGSGSEANGAKTLIYAADNGARIINCSWGGFGVSEVIEQAIAYAESKGVLVVVAAGNDKKNIDNRYFSPGSSPYENILTVGASGGPSGSKATFSNFGKVNVDLAAPGKDIKSSSPSGGYRILSGTSMATPHTAGVAALVWSLKPQLTYSEVKALLMNTTVRKSAWRDRSVTSGILNARQAVDAAAALQ